MRVSNSIKKISTIWTSSFQKMYGWVLKCSEHPQAIWLLALFSFAESSFFPIPPDVLLIPMLLACPKKAFYLAGICTVSSVIGGFAGYGIGMFLYETVAAPIFSFYGYTDKFQTFVEAYNMYGSWIVAAAGFTPFPYKVITITSGITNLNLIEFGIASVISRGGRFFLLAFLIWRFGEPMQRFIEKNLGWLATLFFILLAGGFFALKYL